MQKTSFVLALCVGAAMIATTPEPTFAQQDRSAQSQNNGQGGQKPAPQGNKGQQRPQPSQRPQQGQRPQPSRPQPSKPQPSRPGNNNGRPTIQPVRPQPNRPQPSKPQPNRPGRPTTQPVRPQPNRPQPSKPNRPGRPTTRPNRPQNRPNYQFRRQDTSRLQQYYRGRFGGINRRNRPRFYRGGYIPRTYWGNFQPVPPSLIGYLPAVPPGYAVGYYDGYVVVYDPATWFVLSVLNLMQ